MGITLLGARSFEVVLELLITGEKDYQLSEYNSGDACRRPFWKPKVIIRTGGSDVDASTVIVGVPRRNHA